MLVFHSILTAFGLLSFLFSLLAVFLLVEVVAAWISRLRQRGESLDPIVAHGSQPTRLAVIMPAHNEEAVIERTVSKMLEQLNQGDQLIVVADNCTDRTAKFAFRAGAEVIIRDNPEQRGKGYALQYGVDHLASDPPEVMVIVDADCEIVQGTLQSLAQATAARQCPLQAAYIMPVPAQATFRDRISAFAVMLKNVVRLQGLAAIGGPSLLTGTGMAFPWELAQRTQWASGDIVEDMTIGIELAKQGDFPRFYAPMTISAPLPSTKAAATTQRTRWEHGHLRNIRRFVPQLLISLVKRPSWSMLLLVFELVVPPLSLFAASLLMLLFVAGVVGVIGASLVPLMLCTTAFVAFTLAIMGAWRMEGRNLLSLSDLARVPVYILGKLPIYSAAVRKAETQWHRTDRSAGQVGKPAPHLSKQQTLGSVDVID
ncbi:glycosyltransferase family 2 protein [Aeoliella mucimassa]|uniref:Poly-beta-1,6-N-acetyl-D-glucosamine synthase n=1 Tax=Aeoliella mucimassa TaxID=2527972 RepID=A0A518AQA5_9BACT|nr:glycosyltransferase family 2 protein [Aeoliella mucimassa]QDU56897.1 Poly-beta-1,6-N-acetyl-D-glucosamine synthase [Aeoliella mucimassa]